MNFALTEHEAGLVYRGFVPARETMENPRGRAGEWTNGWVAEDEELIPVDYDAHIGECYKWVTETYITNSQIKIAQDRDDVTLGTIEPSEEHGFFIHVYHVEE